MPYYSYGYGYDSANLIYLILLVPVLLLSLYAQAAVSGNFSRYSKVTNSPRTGPGAQAAAECAARARHYRRRHRPLLRQADRPLRSAQ